MINVTQTSLPSLEEYTKYLKKIWKSRWLTNDGDFVQALEAKLKEYLGVKYLALVSDGTSALQLSLRVLELKGEIITTPFTFAATTNVLLWEGVKPVFADIDPETFNIDPADVERKITRKTTAILATHVYGNPCYVKKLQRIAAKYNLKLIYDGAHAFGVRYNKQSVLNFGDATTLSFHATKIFHTIEGGAIVVRDKRMFDKLRLLRNHGIKGEEDVSAVGINAKMNEFQAAMGLCNLKNIDKKIALQQKIYITYKKRLSGMPVQFQKLITDDYNYGYMPICLADSQKRNQVFSELVKNGIKPRKYFYPLTVDYDYFKKEGIDLVKKYRLNEAAQIADRVLCLPLYSDLNSEVLDKVVRIILKTLEGRT